ncbi:MAG TPA: hypothetical protein VN428_07900 [Bryobacteraceae bacterium]|nr:hypothetical protein [Bryobacteraceae bacterium]
MQGCGAERARHPEQRNWRGDIDDPKRAKSKRTLALGGLAARYADWISKLKHRGPNAWRPQAASLGLRRAQGAQDRRRNRRKWTSPALGRTRCAAPRRQQHRDSKIAGHASTAITEEYTFAQLKRQDELTRRIQDKRSKAAKEES